MGVYREQILPRLIDRACGGRSLAKWQRRLTADLSGVVVEIGSGSGLNIEHLPDSVERLLAVEPSDIAWRLASRRVERATVPVEHIGLDGAAIPLDDSSCDAALATFALCTIRDVETALAEVMRVLKPGGRFHVLEHGLAPDDSVRRWQRRLEPMQKRLADGCHLTRDPVALITSAGFEIIETTSLYGRGPKPWMYFTEIQARKPE
jgi:ubiquinone/menaquinone biosynthesis C-methylase UbiE